MKRIISLALCIVLLCFFCGCKKADNVTSNGESTAAVTEAANDSDIIRKFSFSPDVTHKISYEYMNLLDFGFSRDIEQTSYKDGSFSYFITDRQWNHGTEYDETIKREFYYQYEDGSLICYMKEPDGKISHGEVEQEVLDSMNRDKAKIISTDAIIPTYAEGFTEVVEGTQYTFSMPVKDIIKDDNMLSSFISSIFTASGFEYNDTLGLDIICTIDAYTSDDGTVYPTKVSYDFDQIKPFVLSKGAMSGEYALDVNLITMTYEFDYNMDETVEIPEEFYPTT